MKVSYGSRLFKFDLETKVKATVIIINKYFLK